VIQKRVPEADSIFGIDICHEVVQILLRDGIGGSRRLLAKEMRIREKKERWR